MKIENVTFFRLLFENKVDGSYEETQYSRYDVLFKGMLETSRLIGIGRSEMRSSQLRKDMQRELRDVWRKLKGEPLFSLRDKMSFFLAGWMFPLFTLALSARSALTSRIKIKVKE